MEKIKLLLVDDEKEFVEALKERLELRKFVNADVAFDGESAIEKIREEEPHLVILDIKMPGMDGFEVLRIIKREYPTVEVVMLSAYSDKRNKATAQTLGADGFLEKPVNFSDLLIFITAVHDRINDQMTAITLAEAGDHEGAREILKGKKTAKKKKQKKK